MKMRGPKSQNVPSRGSLPSLLTVAGYVQAMEEDGERHIGAVERYQQTMLAGLQEFLT